MCDVIFLAVCLTHAPHETSSIFGFADFLAAMALLVLVFNSSDPLYRFRIAIAPIPIILITFISAVSIGIGALITDLWFSERWLAPAFGLGKPVIQATFDVLFLMVVLIWIWFAFVRPPIFGRLNAKAFFRALYGAIVRGSDQQLGIVAVELARSGRSLVRHASGPMPRLRKPRLPVWLAVRLTKHLPKVLHFICRRSPSNTSRIAREIFLLIANRKFCKHIIESSPITVMAIMDEMIARKATNIPLNQFSTLINTAAITNDESIIHHEDKLYSGALGKWQPYSKIVYGNYRIVESIGGLDLHYRVPFEMTPQQLDAYCRIVLITFESYIESKSWWNHSYSLYRAIHNIQTAASIDVHSLNGRQDYNQLAAFERLSSGVEFVANILDYLSERPEIKFSKHFDKKNNVEIEFNAIVDLALALIEAASYVSSPWWPAWDIQHNTVWCKLTKYNKGGAAWGVFHKRLRRLAFEIISEFDKWPNYRCARYLGFFLNVCAFARPHTSNDNVQEALRRYVMRWTQKNYLTLRQEYPDVADACLIGNVSLDEDGKRLVQSYRANMKGEVPKAYLELDPPRSPKVDRK